MAVTAQDLIDAANAAGFSKEDLSKFFGAGSSETRDAKLDELRKLVQSQFDAARDSVIGPAAGDKNIPVPTFAEFVTAFSTLK